MCLLEGATASLPKEAPAESADIISPEAEPGTCAAINGAGKASETEEGESDADEDGEDQLHGNAIAAEQVQKDTAAAFILHTETEEFVLHTRMTLACSPAHFQISKKSRRMSWGDRFDRAGKMCKGAIAYGTASSAGVHTGACESEGSWRGRLRWGPDGEGERCGHGRPGGSFGSSAAAGRHLGAVPSGC